MNPSGLLGNHIKGNILGVNTEDNLSECQYNGISTMGFIYLLFGGFN